MENIEAIPEEEKIWLCKNAFAWQGWTWVYMGAWAGWMRADRFRLLEDGTVVGYRLEHDEKRATQAMSMLKNTARRLALET